LEDNSGNIWIGSWGGGVSIYNGGSFAHFTEIEDLSSQSVHSILEDSRGNLWIGTYLRGVSMYNGKSFANFPEIEGLRPDHVSSILEDTDGNLWFGTDSDGVIRYNGETFTHFTEKEGLSNNAVSSILEDRHGNLWFGNWGKGVSMYNGETFTYFTDKEGISNNNVWSMLEDSNGNLWFGTWGGGVSKYNGETFTHFTEKEGLSNNNVRVSFEDSHGNLWFGTAGGASMFNGDTFTHFTQNEGLNDNSIFSILEDSTGNIWLSTLKGLNQLEFNPESVSINEDNLSDSGVKNDSVNVVFHKPVIHSYGLKEGLKGADFTRTSVILDSRNRILWGTLSGLTMLEMNNFKIPEVPPASMQLNWIDINGQFIDYRQMNEKPDMKIKFASVARFNNYPLNLELPYFKNHLTFHFSAIDWYAPHKIMYSYKMEDLNDHWSNPTAEAKADFRNLPYGTFTFKVRAIGEAQKWSEPFEYTFTIQPPWWHSWWARTGYGIMAFLLIIVFIRWRTARLKQRQKELEAEVRYATKEIREQKEEVESQRDEIEAQKDEIQQQKEAITDSIEYAKRIQTATLPPDEELRYHFPKHFILYKPLDIVSGDFYWLTQKKEKIIIAVADCTGHGVPGAFMSMLGSAFLNEIVNNIKNTLQANLILNELREKVIFSLRQTGAVDEARDGMDISLVILDRDNMALQYAGAHNPLYHLRNGKLTEIKADMMPIGISSEAAKSFSNHEIGLRKDDLLYLFSDGYTDQLGGERRKRFTTSRFKQKLLEIQDRIMFDQRAILEQTLDEWMGLNGAYENKYEQIDDILVMGIRIN
jgi:serine phosphatase RsbU (regulator of sigma subunit)/streptogramin lyase